MATRTAICRMDAGSYRKDAKTGYLYADVYPTKAGVFPYMQPDGSIVRELRPREEVHSPRALASFENKPVTNSHPPVLLNSANTSKYQVGSLYGSHDVAEDGIHTKSKVVVTDAAAIADIEAGKEQVSCGYDCEIEDTAGIDPEFGPFDRIQRGHDGNHLAIEWRGRAVSARLVPRADGDSATPVARFDAWEVDDDSPSHDSPTQQPSGPASAGSERADQSDLSTNRRRPMPTTRIDSRDFECSEALQIALENKFKADAAALEAADKAAAQAKADAEKARSDAEAAQREAQKAYDALKAKHDAAEEKVLTPDALAKLVNERADALSALRTKAAALLPKDFKFDGLDEAAIKRAVVAAVKPELKLDGQSAEYIAMRFDICVEDAATTTRRNPVLDALDAAAPASDSDFWRADALAI